MISRWGWLVLLASGYYIDLNQSAAEHYLLDPLGDSAATLRSDQKARVLGGEATMWTDDCLRRKHGQPDMAAYRCHRRALMGSPTDGVCHDNFAPFRSHLHFASYMKM
jgi:hypothetical protein